MEIKINCSYRYYEVVNEFLINNFNEILDYGFTAKVEQDFDDIANGAEKWKETLKSFMIISTRKLKM